MKAFRPLFKEGDLVMVVGTSITGEIIYIDWSNLKADVEWEEYDYVTSDSFSLYKLQLLDAPSLR